MQELHTILSNNNLVPILLFVIGGFIAVISIIFAAGKSISINKERERTRRELAAYVAEGSMTPDDAERLLKATPDQ